MQRKDNHYVQLEIIYGWILKCFYNVVNLHLLRGVQMLR